MDVTGAASFISIGKDVVLAITAAVGATVAVLGLGAWKRQLKGQSEYTLARRLLRLCYQYRDAVAAVRHPAMWANEMPATPEDAGITGPEQKRFYGRRKAYEARWEKVRSVRSELYPELLEAEVFWDQELTALMKPLFQLEMDLLIAIQDQLELENPDAHPSEKEHLQDREGSQRRRDLLYRRFSREDTFEKQFNVGLEAIGAFLKKHLKK